MNVMIHHLADCRTEQIGANTRIWQFVVILPGARIGSDCNICSHCLIENEVVVGNRVTVKSGVQLWDGIRLEDDVFVGPNVTFTNDKYPRSKRFPQTFPITTVQRGASIGGGGRHPAGPDHRRTSHGRCRGGRHERRSHWCHRGGQSGTRNRLREVGS